MAPSFKPVDGADRFPLEIKYLLTYHEAFWCWKILWRIFSQCHLHENIQARRSLRML